MSDLLDRLARLDTCAVSDALDQLDISGATLGLQALAAQRRIVGRAVTVLLGPADAAPSKRHLCTAAVETSGPGDVIVIAHNGRMDVAGWGGILSLGARLKNLEGVVIDGVCRDLDEAREFGLALYGRGAVTVTARGRIVEKDWNVAVEIAGVLVAPGDLVIADASGVVFIPIGRAGEVLSAAERIVQREKLMLADLRDGKPISAVMGANYESMLQKDVER